MAASVGTAFAQAPDPVPPAPPAPPAPQGGEAPAPAPTEGAPESPAPTPASIPTPALPTPRSAAEKKAADKVARTKAIAACSAHEPGCDWIATLSSLERLSMKRAIEARGFVVEPGPWGKVIGTVHIYNEDVFAEKNRWLQLLNFFHYTTRESTIRKDLVVQPGEVYDQEIVEETARHLRDPLYTSVIAIIPVASRESGKVDLLVVTRDIWSLRLNTQYTFQQGTLTNLSTSLSENNFLGYRTVLAAGLTMDQGAIAMGPLLIDKNFLGRHVELRARVNTIVNRGQFFDGNWDNEGSSSTISLSKTLWRLASEWGGSVSFSHRDAIERSYSGLDLRPIYCPEGATACSFPTRAQAAMLPAGDLFGQTYHNRTISVSVNATRQWGTKLKHQLSFGHVVDSFKYYTLPGFAGSPGQQQLFADAVLPPSEVNSAPYVSYSFFQPRYKTRRNVGTYDLAEDLRTGPDFEVSYGLGLTALGSSQNFQRGGIGVGYTLGFGTDASARLATSYGGRFQDGKSVDNTYSVNGRLVTDSIGGYFRVIMEAQVATRWNDRVTRFYSIGSDNGLRGFNINEFFGRRLASSQVEARSTPTPIWVFRVGGVAFYDIGGAADTLGEIAFHHDVGLGLRALLPQTSRELFRFDLAFPLNGDAPGHPKFIAGFQSEF